MSATLKSRLPLIAAELRPLVGAAIKAGAQVIAEDAKARVPVGHPDVHLRDAIHVEREGAAGYYVVAGDDATFYGHMVEFGTSHSAPRPFLLPAVEAQRDAVVSLASLALRKL